VYQENNQTYLRHNLLLLLGLGSTLFGGLGGGRLGRLVTILLSNGLLRGDLALNGSLFGSSRRLNSSFASGLKNVKC
jgi:hypothetical protein